MRRCSNWLLPLFVLVASCARPQATTPSRPIDRLRAQAARHPEDAALWRELAIAEHLGDGGDPERAREALARAEKLSPDDLQLALMAAEAHVLEGRPDQALSAYLQLLKRVPDASAPLAQPMAELALFAIADMNDAVDDYRARVLSSFKALAPRADALGLNAGHQLRMQLMHYALLAGDRSLAAELAAAAGCIQRVQVAGPFGPHALLGFDTPYEAEKPGPLAAEHDLGPGREVAPVRDVETRRCLLALGRGVHDPLPGTTIVRAEVEAKAPGGYALRVESPNSFAVWLDGKPIARLDLRKRAPEGVHYWPISLTAGKHELKLKISSRHPNPALSLALVPATRAAVEGAALPPGRSTLSTYVAAKLALARGNAVKARTLARGQGMSQKTAHWLVLEAAASLADPLRGVQERRDAARSLLRKAQRANQAAWYPPVGLAHLDAAEGRTKEALEALRRAAARNPDAVAIRTSLIQLLQQGGYTEEAERVLDALRQRMPNACALIDLALSTAQQRGRVDEIAQLTDATMRCDAGSTARFSLYKSQRKYAQAAEELLRLRALGEPLDEGQTLESELELAQLRGDAAAVATLRKRRSQRWSDRPQPVLDRADALVAGGQRSEALRYLDAAIQQHPDTLFELSSVHEALGGPRLLADFRKDGDATIRAYQRAGRSYQEPQVLVLDYTVVRIFKDGSSLELTHNVMHVRTQEAVDQNGEFAPPDGARLLKLHTIKPDGRKLEPDPISGKDTWSLPNLSPGDYIEFETLRVEPPPAGFPGGYLGNRFYFQSFEIPFDHTELVVLLDPDLTPVLEPRGDAPEALSQTRDGLTVLRWSRTESRPLRPEPGSVAAREFIPSINLGIRASWDSYVQSLRDMLADKDVYDPEAARWVEELLSALGEAPASVRAERLYRFVTDEIEPTENVFGQAPAMLDARTGSRERVLQYLLDLAGIASELGLVRGAEADHQEALLPDPDVYGHLLLRVATEKGPVWLHAGARHAPFGYLPPHVRDEKALMLNEQAEPARTPPTDLAEERLQTDVEISLARDDSARIRVRQVHRGTSAVSWRNDLESIPEAELETRFEESYAANLVPGARLASLEIEGKNDPEAPLLITFTLSVDQLGHRVGDQLRIPGLFASQLQARFARQSTRTTTALIPMPQVSDVRLRVVLPEGAKAVALPQPGEQRYGDLATFKSGAKVDESGVVELVRRLRIPSMRVTADDYRDFARFCRAVDLAEASELALALPKADQPG